MAPVHEPLPPNVSFPALEEEVLVRWRERDVFRESMRRRAGGPPFVFYEGPPTANGFPGSHHVLARVFKDVFPRYKTMTGHHVERKAGWDTHGLPVEIAVEQKLGFRHKDDIERYGIAKFNAQCREAVLEHLEDWKALTERIAYWVDLDDAYYTLDPGYVESVWWALKTMWDRDLLFEGHKVVHYCARCGTSLSSHEVAQGYQDVEDPSIYVRFGVVEPAGALRAGDTLLIWTTTPWTLVSNAAVAVDPGLTYVRTANGEVLAEALAERVLGEGVEIADRFTGAEMIGARYEPPFPFIPGSEYGEKGHTVLPADFVSADDGTGIVHTAIAFGEDDFRLGAEQGLAVVNPVRLDGTYDERIAGYEGRWVKDADQGLIDDLRARGRLLRSERCCMRTRTAGAAARRSSTTPSRPGTSARRRCATACSPPTRRSSGIRRTSSTAASASGWRTTSTGPSRASATGARRSPSGAARTATSSASGRSPRCRSAPASRCPIRTARSSMSTPGRARSAGARCAACPR